MSTNVSETKSTLNEEKQLKEKIDKKYIRKQEIAKSIEKNNLKIEEAKTLKNKIPELEVEIKTKEQEYLELKKHSDADNIRKKNIAKLPKYGINIKGDTKNINIVKATKDKDFAFIEIGRRETNEFVLPPISGKVANAVKYFDQNNIKVGFYMTTKVSNPSIAKSDAEFILSYIEDLGINATLHIGIYGDFNSSETIEKNTQTILSFCNVIENYGHVPIVFTDLKNIEDNLLPYKLDKYDFFIDSACDGKKDIGDAPLCPVDYSIWNYENTNDKSLVNGTVGFCYHMRNIADYELIKRKYKKSAKKTNKSKNELEKLIDKYTKTNAVNIEELEEKNQKYLKLQNEINKEINDIKNEISKLHKETEKPTKIKEEQTKEKPKTEKRSENSKKTVTEEPKTQISEKIGFLENKTKSLNDKLKGLAGKINSLENDGYKKITDLGNLLNRNSKSIEDLKAENQEMQKKINDINKKIEVAKPKKTEMKKEESKETNEEIKSDIPKEKEETKPTVKVPSVEKVAPKKEEKPTNKGKTSKNLMDAFIGQQANEENFLKAQEKKQPVKVKPVKVTPERKKEIIESKEKVLIPEGESTISLDFNSIKHMIDNVQF